ncbi:MAG: hypothetical protein LBI38_05385 [Oscillospiraceae bacterium]|nr:hypothetical protein [Oscillospiraceae bacterium]
MKAKIDGKTYDTEKAVRIGHRYYGEFGQPEGYEEQLFVANNGRHFVYGVGGSESPYSKPGIKLLPADGESGWERGD